MRTGWSPVPGRRRFESLLDDDRAWLLLAGAAAAVIYLAYLTTHTHPAYEGGLFLDIAERIVRADYRLPDRIPGYTREGVPFAYPPLAFYVLAVILATTTFDPVTIELVVPGLVVIGTVVPYYYAAKRLLGTPKMAGVATVIFVSTPAVLRWHLSAGGIVRAPALFIALTGVYAGVRLFHNRERRWLIPATLLFGVTVLTHPHYTAFFGLSYLILYAGFDRSLQGLGAGIVVGIGGLALTAPWWLQVVMAHGPEVFLAASGSHSGLLGGLGRVERQFLVPLAEADPITPFYVAAFAGGAYALARREYVLPAWMILSSYVIGKDRFLFVAGAMVIGFLVWEGLVPRVRRLYPWAKIDRLRRVPGRSPGIRLTDGGRRDRIAAVATVGLVLVAATGVGALFAGSVLATAHDQSTALPQTVDAEDRRAMDWVATNTAPDSSVLVVGDAAEWYPYYTDRTIVVGPWGHEWTAAQRYYDEIALFKAVSTCAFPPCLNTNLAAADRQPDYVVIPVGEYTVRGKEYRFAHRHISAYASDEGYRIAYRNQGVVVFRITGDMEPAAQAGTDIMAVRTTEHD